MSKSVDDNSSLESFSIESPAPLYARVKQAITQKIRSGAWLPNSKLPSESELLSLLGVSRMTINRALRELTIEGLLVRMQGVGTFVAVPKGNVATECSTVAGNDVLLALLLVLFCYLCACLCTKLQQFFAAFLCRLLS